MTEPGNEMAADAGGCDRLLVCREQVTRTLKAALVQGRLTEDEYDERVGQASASRSRAELAALTADLPVGQMDSPARPPAARDVWDRCQREHRRGECGCGRPARAPR
jgi:Domain of unknown function (DUF1707)